MNTQKTYREHMRHALNLDNNFSQEDELEERLSEHQQSEYIKFMIWNRIGPDNTNLVIWEAFVSTASQRSEALCRVLFPERFK